MKAEMEMAMKLLEKNVHEKQGISYHPWVNIVVLPTFLLGQRRQVLPESLQRQPVGRNVLGTWVIHRA